jgi:hypothetical protein
LDYRNPQTFAGLLRDFPRSRRSSSSHRCAHNNEAGGTAQKSAVHTALTKSFGASKGQWEIVSGRAGQSDKDQRPTRDTARNTDRDDRYDQLRHDLPSEDLRKKASIQTAPRKAVQRHSLEGSKGAGVSSRQSVEGCSSPKNSRPGANREVIKLAKKARQQKFNNTKE